MKCYCGSLALGGNYLNFFFSLSFFLSAAKANDSFFMVELVMKYLERMRMSLTKIWPKGRHVLMHTLCTTLPNKFALGNALLGNIFNLAS